MGSRQLILSKQNRRVLSAWVLAHRLYHKSFENVTERRPYKQNRAPTREWLLRRETSGFSASLVKELRTEDEQEFKRMFRVDSMVFQEILDKVEPALKKQSTVMKTPILTKTALEITLRYLADGTSYSSLSYQFRVSTSYICNIIPVVCDAISVSFAEFTQVPSSRSECLKISEDFERLWNFPHCIGAVDGKHIAVIKPPNSGSEYFNYKGFFSVILLAAIDAHGRVIAYDVGRPGSCGDAGVFINSGFNNILKGVPSPEPISGYPEVGYHFIGDDAFALTGSMLKPYRRRDDSVDKAIFNYRLSRARRISENCFGILSSRF